MTPAEVAENFWSKVDRRTETDCWVWRAATDRKGYGRAYVGRLSGLMLAHRFAWTLAQGPIPEGVLVCHHCDNPPCCNPRHLFLGTVRDNAIDMERKGRGYHPVGRANKRAKLTLDAAAAILADPRGCCTVAREHGVSNSTVQWIRKNGWGGLPANPVKRIHAKTLARLTRERSALSGDQK